VDQVLSGGIGVTGSGEEVGNMCGRVNMVQILCTHVCKWKMISFETIPGIEGGEIKENWGEFKCDIL
jgi:hypothetical protein